MHCTKRAAERANAQVIVVSRRCASERANPNAVVLSRYFRVVTCRCLFYANPNVVMVSRCCWTATTLCRFKPLEPPYHGDWGWRRWKVAVSVFRSGAEMLSYSPCYGGHNLVLDYNAIFQIGASEASTP